MNLTLRQIEIFLILARTFSFSETAKICHLSQPALSASVKRMEEIVGARLFDRHTRKVALTAVGQQMLEAVAPIQAQVGHAVQRVRDCVEGVTGAISVAITPTLAAAFAPPLISKFMANHRDVDLRLQAAYSDASVELLRRGEVDLAIVPLEENAPDLIQEALFRDPLVVLFPPDHPLSRKKLVHWSDLCEYPHLVLGGSSNVRTLIEFEYMKHGMTLKPAYEVNHGGALIGLVAADCGIAVLPESVTYYCNLQGMLYRRIQSASGYRTICTVTLAGKTPSPLVQIFNTMCHEHAQQYPLRWSV